MEKYEIITRLGGGSFADVYKALEKSTNSYVAIKTLKKKYSKWEDCLELRECRSLQKLNDETLSSNAGYDNIIKLKEIIFIKEKGTLNLIFEYLETDLYELMKNHFPKKLTEKEIRSIMYQTLQGLHFMHKYNFFHRDMKPENLLIINEKVKIADFGLAREIRSIPPYTEYVSTRYYRAPECILKSNNYNSPIDIWGLGCIMAEMYLHPQPLFFGNNEKEVLFKICSILGTPNHDIWNDGINLGKKNNLKFPNFNKVNLKDVIKNASDDAIDLISLMLQWDPNKRPNANNLLGHKFFTNYDISFVNFYDGNIGNFNYNNNNNFRRFSNRRVSKVNADLRKNSISRILEDNDGFDKLINDLKKVVKDENVEIEKEKENFEEKFEKEFINDEKRNYNSNNDFKEKLNLRDNSFNDDDKDFIFDNNYYKNIKTEGNINLKNHNIDFDFGFDTNNDRLKSNFNNNPRERSAKRFLEQTENEMNNNFNRINYNNNNFGNSNSQGLFNEFGGRRNINNNNNNNNNNDIHFDNLNRRENNNKNSHENKILFGMESRRRK